MTDFDLVQQLIQGNETAFEKLFNKYFDGLCLFAETITKDHDIALDIVEEIFLQLWLNGKIKTISISVKGYLYQSVYNNSIKYISRKRNIESLDNFENSVSFSQSYASDYPLSNIINRELEDKAEEIINLLPAQCKQIYLLNRDEGLKYYEIAKRLNVSESTVKTQMSRAFAKLRENLKDFLYLFF